MESYIEKHNKLLRRIAPECTVLLKSNAAFPLDKPCKLALYGNGAENTLIGGTGSGAVNRTNFVSVRKGLENAGFEITTGKWLKAYSEIRKNAQLEFDESLKKKYANDGVLGVISMMGAIMPEPNYYLPLDGEGSTAVYVLSRVCGEGRDRQNISGDYKLTSTEIRDILYLEKTCTKFILVLNTGNSLDLSPIANSISNILLLSQLGDVTGFVLADILIGKSYPSGKLGTTWFDYKSYPSSDTFGEKDDVRYKEGIYVGYRYFDTFGVKPTFMFGHGLSFTDFKIDFKECFTENLFIKIIADVTNIGLRTGKEVLQLYLSSPNNNIDVPLKILVDFCKTKELKRGENCRCELSFKLSDFAVYSENENAFKLYKGRYNLYLGNSLDNSYYITNIYIENDFTVKTAMASFGKPDFTDIVPSKFNLNKNTSNNNPIKIQTADINDGLLPEKKHISSYNITCEEAAFLSVGAFGEKEIGEVIGNAGKHIKGAAGETTDKLQSKTVPFVTFADGPAGLRLSDEVSVSALPVASALAQSFNKELWGIVGDVIGTEMEITGVDIWLAPALNIVRNPLCGRNFEYFSEDPLLIEYAALYITGGVQSHKGKDVAVKHFAANNQETNRFRSNSIVSDRALREVYLKAFEMVIKETKPFAVMSSYNLLNGIHTAENKTLLTDVLRKEWGFEGVVISDWIIHIPGAGQGSKYGQTEASKAIAAGNNLIMPGSQYDFDNIMSATENGSLSKEVLIASAAEIITAIEKLKKYEQ